MGDGDDRNSSALIYEKLRDAKLSDSNDVRGLLADSMKRLTINGHGVTGGGLSYSIGNTGLGVVEGVTGATSEPSQLSSQPEIRLPEINIPPPIPSPVNITIEQAAPLPAPALTPTLLPADTGQGIQSSPPEQPIPGEQLIVTVTGAVNGVPATLRVYAASDWIEI